MKQKQTNYDWLAIGEEIEANLEFTQDIINNVYGKEENNERNIAFKETLNLLNHLSFKNIESMTTE